MNIKYHRSSSIGQFHYCKMSFFFQYVLGYQSPSNAKADLGSTVHAVLETLAICKQKLQQENSKNKNKKYTITQDPVGEFTFTENELYTDEFIKNTLRTCLEFYINNNPHNEFKYDRDYEFCEKMVFDTITSDSGSFDPRKCEILQPEQAFDLPLEFDWAKYSYTDADGNEKEDYVRIKGTVDLTTIVDGDTIRVTDYKTGQRLDWATGEKKDFKKLMNDTQLLLYNYALSRMYPQYKNIVMTIYFCRDGGPFTLVFDESDMARFLDRLKDLHKEITSLEMPTPRSPSRTDFRCTKLCYFYKNNWKGTNKRMCQYMEDYIKKNGIDQAIADCTKEGFTLDKYVDPGSVDR